MLEAFRYPRVSTEEQKRDGYSIEAQNRLFDDYEKRKNLKVIRRDDFIEVETAGKVGRSKFTEMVKALKRKGSPKIVLVEKTDRLTRNFYDMIKIDELIYKHGVEFHLVKAGRILGPNMGRSEKTAWALEVLIAKDFLDNLTEETRKGVRAKILAGGWCSHAPLGYKMQDGKLKVDPGRSKMAKRAFELYATGFHSLAKVSDILSEEGFTYQPTKRKIPKHNLCRILHNPLYIAQNYYEGMAIDMIHEPLVDRKTWFDVQRVAGKGKILTMQKREFLYHDLLTCGACGSALCGEEKQGGKYIYYRCWQAANGQCDTKYINEKEIEKAIGAKIDRLSFPEGYKEQQLAAIENLETTKKNTVDDEKARINQEIERIKKTMKSAYYDRATGKLSADLWEELADELKTELENKNAALAKIDCAEVDYYDLALKYFELPEMIQLGWSLAPRPVKASLLKILTSKILIYGKTAIIELKPAFTNLYESPSSEENGLWYPEGNLLRNLLFVHRDYISSLHGLLAA